MTRVGEWYAERFKRYGDTHHGLGWWTEEVADDFLRVTFDDFIWPGGPGAWLGKPVSVIDYGCGTGRLLDKRGHQIGDYLGVDLNEDALARARAKHPDRRFVHVDEPITYRKDEVAIFDWAVCIGTFTVRGGDPNALDSMFGAIRQLWLHTTRGVAWNVHTSHVDYQTDEWLHVPFDEMAAFLFKLGVEKWTFRQDFAWPAYTVYAWH